MTAAKRANAKKQSSKPDHAPHAPVPPPPPPPPFIVHAILPKHEVHLIGGPAQAGKSTLMLQLMNDWRQGLNIFGYQSYPAPACLISAVHSTASVTSLLRRLGTDSSDIPSISLVDDLQTKEFDEIVDAASHKVPGLAVIFLDGIVRLCKGSIIDNNIVGEFLSGIVQKLHRRNITLVATGRSAKPKESANGVRSIDRFLGATAWTEYSSCFISIETEHLANDPTDTRRRISVMPKHAPASVMHYRFSSEGHLVEVPPSDDKSSPDRMETLATVILVYPPGRIFTTAELLDIGNDVGIGSRATLMRYLQLMMKQGRLLDAGHGRYSIPAVN